MREGCAINKSLSALGMIIKELSQAQDSAKAYLPFRTSKLTFLLKDSLAGNSKTHMLAAISPAQTNLEESLSTLRFASSVKEIKTTAKQNKVSKLGMIADLKKELEEAKAQLSEAQKFGWKQGGAFDDSAKRASIEEQELFLEAMMPDYHVQVKKAQAMEQQREDAMEDGALSREEITNMFGVNEQTPYLLNVADDPALAGALIYYVEEGEQKRLSIGSSRDNTIQLHGIGISEFLCTIENRDGNSIYIRKCNIDGRIFVDGRPMEAAQVFKLKHGQNLCFGRAHAFKLCKPGHENEGRSVVLNQLLDGTHEDNAELESSPSFANAEAAFQRALQQVNEEYGKELLHRITVACKACDEANEITAECRQELEMRFQVTITDVNIFPPDVVVRALVVSDSTMGKLSVGRPSMGGPNIQPEYKQLFCMNATEMVERLDRMHEIYNHHHLESDGIPLDLLQDPWKQVTHADLMHQTMLLEMKLESESAHRRQQEEYAKRLEVEINDLRAENRLFMKPDTPQSISASREQRLHSESYCLKTTALEQWWREECKLTDHGMPESSVRSECRGTVVSNAGVARTLDAISRKIDMPERALLSEGGDSVSSNFGVAKTLDAISPKIDMPEKALRSKGGDSVASSLGVAKTLDAITRKMEELSVHFRANDMGAEGQELVEAMHSAQRIVSGSSAVNREQQGGCRYDSSQLNANAAQQPLVQQRAPSPYHSVPSGFRPGNSGFAPGLLATSAYSSFDSYPTLLPCTSSSSRHPSPSRYPCARYQFGNQMVLTETVAAPFRSGQHTAGPMLAAAASLPNAPFVRHAPTRNH